MTLHHSYLPTLLEMILRISQPLKFWLSLMVIRGLFKIVAHPHERFLVEMLAQDLKPDGKSFLAKPTGDRQPRYPGQAWRQSKDV